MPGQYINHFASVRARVTGAGNLRLKLISLDDVKELELVPIVMEIATNKYQTKLANFNQNQAKLEIKTTEIDEVFNIRRILIYQKPVSTSYPNN